MKPRINRRRRETENEINKKEEENERIWGEWRDININSAPSGTTSEKQSNYYQFPHRFQLAVGMDINIRHIESDIRKVGDGFIFTKHAGLTTTMSGEATSSTATAQVVAAEQKGERLESGEESELSKLESEAETSGKGEMSVKGTGRPEFNGDGKQQSTQDFFRRGNGNRSMHMHCSEDSDDDVVVTRGEPVIGEHSRTPSSPQIFRGSRYGPPMDYERSWRTANGKGLYVISP